MEWGSVSVLSVALLGLILGSFLNAWLFRYNTGRSVARGRSCCMRCGHTLATRDLVPVLSYVWLWGKCRYCSSRVSLQYPLVEAAVALMAVLVYLQSPNVPSALAAFGAWYALIFIFVYDLRHQIIPTAASILLSFILWAM